MEKPKSFYRNPEIRSALEKKSEKIFGGKELAKPSIDAFFVLEGTELSDAEEHDVRLWMEYVGKRLTNAALHWPVQEVKKEETVLGKLHNKKETFGFIPFHDPAHAITAYERSNENSFVPRFMKMSAEEALTNPEIVLEEFPALLWSKPAGGWNFFITLMDGTSGGTLFKALRDRANSFEGAKRYLPEIARLEASLDPSNFESVRRTYEEAIVMFLKTSKPENIAPEILKRAEPAFAEALAQSASHPDEKYIAFARKIFEEYPKNKRVFLEEFERIFKPLLERLRKKEEARQE